MYLFKYEILLSLHADTTKYLEGIKYNKYTTEELACECAEELIDKIKSVLDDESLRADYKAYEILMLLTFGRGI